MGAEPESEPETQPPPGPAEGDQPPPGPAEGDAQDASLQQEQKTHAQRVAAPVALGVPLADKGLTGIL